VIGRVPNQRMKLSRRGTQLMRDSLGSRGKVHLMRWVRYVAVIVLLLLAGLWGAMRVVPRWQARQLTPVMSAYLRAAAAGDSAALIRITTSSVPVRWGLLVHREAPAFLDEAARRARPEWVSARVDTTIVSFRTHSVPDPQCVFRPLDNVQGKFARGTYSVWRLVSVAVPEC
jgi:hypothetical protein